MAKPLSDAAAAAAEAGSACFRVVETPGKLSIEVDEGSGNTFHLGPILRKYTGARLQVKGTRKTTSVDLAMLYDALGMLRSLRYDVEQFNSAAGHELDMPVNEMRYRCYRLTRQAAAFGVRVPRPGKGTVEVPGLDALVALVEAVYADQITAARTLLAGGLVDFNALPEFYLPGMDLLDRGAATGIFGVPTAMRVRACFVSRGRGMLGESKVFWAALEFVVSVGARFAVVEHQFPISDYPGTR
jgi:hypothetical protein